jgi:hypothetical protein
MFWGSKEPSTNLEFSLKHFEKVNEGAAGALGYCRGRPALLGDFVTAQCVMLPVYQAYMLASNCGYEPDAEEQAARLVRLAKDLARIETVCKGRNGGWSPVAHNVAADGSLAFEKSYHSNLRCSLFHGKVALVMDSSEIECLWQVGFHVLQLFEKYLDLEAYSSLSRMQQVNEALFKTKLHMLDDEVKRTAFVRSKRP